MKIIRNGKKKQNLLRDYAFIIGRTVGTILYLGYETNEGKWLIKEFDEATEMDMQYANFSNNDSYTDLATAFTNKATLTYEDYSSLTGV